MSDEFREIVRQIKERVDIVELVGRQVALKRAGASFKGLCPFHNEKTPSFNVVPAKGIFHCFGCGAGGTVIDWVMRTDRLEFIEAVERLAGELGLEIPRTGSYSPEQASAAREHRETLRSACEEAAEYFARQLKGQKNPLATAYLPQRGIPHEMVESFQIGAALDAWDGLLKALARKGFSDELLVDAGLAVRSEKGSVYDRFRNRLIFPIHDHNGKICGFGGRQLDKEDKGAKYINSPETELYKKSQLLYALHLAKEPIARSGYAIICEGYMDVVTCHQHGHTEAVASLGTAFTRDQAKLLKRFAKRVFFLYDGDKAGQSKMLEGGLPLLEADFDVRIISLPPEHDPDTFLRAEGGKALYELMGKAEEFIDFAIRRHAQGLDLKALGGQAELVERIAPVINALRNEVMRAGAVSRVLARLGNLPREAVENIVREQARKTELEEKRRQERDQPADEDDNEGPPPTDSSSAQAYHAAPPPAGLERRLLKLMIECAEALELVRSRLRHNWVIDHRLAPWIFFLNDHEGTADDLLQAVEVLEGFDGERNVLSEIIAWSVPQLGCTQQAAEEVLLLLHERHQQELTGDLLRMISEKQFSDEAARKLLNAYHAEHQARIKNAGARLRTKNAAARRARFTRPS